MSADLFNGLLKLQNPGLSFLRAQSPPFEVSTSREVTPSSPRFCWRVRPQRRQAFCKTTSCREDPGLRLLWLLPFCNHRQPCCPLLYPEGSPALCCGGEQLSLSSSLSPPPRWPWTKSPCLSTFVRFVLWQPPQAPCVRRVHARLGSHPLSLEELSLPTAVYAYPMSKDLPCGNLPLFQTTGHFS